MKRKLSRKSRPQRSRLDISNDIDQDNDAGDKIATEPKPHALIQAVTGLEARRRSVLRARKEADRRHVESLKPHLQEVWAEAFGQAKRHQQESLREAQSEARVRFWQRWYKKQRLKPKALGSMSSQELQSEIDHAIDEESEKRGIVRAKGETKEQWYGRINALYRKVDEIGYVLFERQRMAKVCYVEGYPSNVHTVHPKFMPPEKPGWSGAGKCLQCRAKRLPCSHSKLSKYIKAGDGECTRCRRQGDKCLVKMRGTEEDLPWNYAYAKKSNAEDDSEEALDELYELLSGLWAIRVREGRIKPFGMWHENDRPQNRENPGYKPLSWEQVLRSQPTKWRFHSLGARNLATVQEPDRARKNS
ncbi:hypothetical protein BGZ63DRAFT_260244 [Mariannaea sp. PMI_226]|nr:hypothetical protein BGZ63DRAFT_260244 [Mariannaea sp. PMI_226]